MKKARRGETSFRSLSLTCIHGFVSVWGDVGRVCLCGVVSPLVGCFFAWLLPVFPPHPVNRRSFHCSLRRLMKGGLLYVLLTVCQSFRLLCADNTAYTTRQFESTWDDTQTFLSPVKTRSMQIRASAESWTDEDVLVYISITDSSFCEYFWWKWLDCHVNALFLGGLHILPSFFISWCF